MAMQGMESLRIEDKQLSQRIKTLFQKESQDWLEIDFSYWHHDNDIQDKFNKIKDAIFNHFIINFDYINMQGNQSEKKVYPIKIFFKAQSWYLQAYDLIKKDYRTYKFSRIYQLVMTTQRFEQDLKDVPSLHRYEEKTETIDIVLKFDKSVGSFVYDEFAYQDIEDIKDGYIVKTQMPHHSWLISFVLSFGNNVEVIQPLFLRESIKNEIELISNKYL